MSGLVERGVEAIRHDHHYCSLKPSVRCGELAVVEELERLRAVADAARRHAISRRYHYEPDEIIHIKVSPATAYALYDALACLDGATA